MFRFRKKKGGDADAAGSAESAPEDPTLLRGSEEEAHREPDAPVMETDGAAGASTSGLPDSGRDAHAEARGPEEGGLCASSPVWHVRVAFAGRGNLILGEKELNEDLLEELETQLLVADVGVDASIETSRA